MTINVFHFTSLHHKAENVSLQHGRKNKNKHNDTNAISDIMFLLPLAFAT